MLARSLAQSLADSLTATICSKNTSCMYKSSTSACCFFCSIKNLEVEEGWESGSGLEKIALSHFLTVTSLFSWFDLHGFW